MTTSHHADSTSLVHRLRVRLSILEFTVTLNFLKLAKWNPGKDTQYVISYLLSTPTLPLRLTLQKLYAQSDRRKGMDCVRVIIYMKCKPKIIDDDFNKHALQLEGYYNKLTSGQTTQESSSITKSGFTSSSGLV